MNQKIIGYAEAKARMQEGFKVLTVPQFRGGDIPYLQSPDGKRDDRIRSDSWDKLRRECHLEEKLEPHKRGGRCLWAYGDKVVGPRG